MFAFTYDKFKEIAQHSKSKKAERGFNEVLASTTALVHDAYLKLHPEVLQDLNNRKEFFALVAKTMRHILIDQYRKANASKRTAIDHSEIDTSEESDFISYIQIDSALDKLSQNYPRQAKILQFKYFLGFLNKEIAELFSLSESTVDKDLMFSKKWIKLNAV